MRLRRKPWAEPEVLESNLLIKNPKDFKGKWNEVFKNNNEICLELGCGKGKFISEIAQKYPNKNFVAMDLRYEVLVYVKRKCEEFNLKNVRILSFDINNIDEIFEENEVSDIYLNFSAPWPKSRHHKRRLTYPPFLKKYSSIMKKGSKIYFKTDHEDFFLHSIDYINQSDFKILFKTMDLHNENIENIFTEYEEKFSNKGMKIMSLICKETEEI